MSSAKTPEHYPAAVLLEYFEHRLPEAKEKKIEEHLGVCQQCAAEARKVRRFVHLWRNWTARSHAKAHRRNAKSKPSDESAVGKK
jgi:hypothetical protein